MSSQMFSRLVVPLGFLIGLAALFFVMQTLGNQSTSSATAPTGPDLLKQYAIKPVAPFAATVTAKDGQKVDLSSLLTKPTVLTFWSVGCSECEIGLPVLDSYSKSQSTVSVILVDNKDTPADAQAKLNILKVSLVTYYDTDGSAFQTYEATMPSSYYIAGNQILYFFPGRVSQDLLQALLSVK